MTGVRRCGAFGCTFETTSRISLGMHRAYKHNQNHPYRRYLEKKRKALLEPCPTCGRTLGEHTGKDISACLEKEKGEGKGRLSA